MLRHAAALPGGADRPPALRRAAANTRVKVADAAVGRRDSYGLVYVPAEKALICFGGCLLSNPAMDPAAAEAPYSEMTLNLEKGRWENRFPRGKAGLWGGLTGPAKAPAFPGSYYAFSLQDSDGNARPYLGAGYYNHMWNWGNYAFDSDRGRLVVYWTLPQQTAEYDPAARTWQLIAAAGKVSREFNEAMYFGAMCYDPVNKEVLGGQGGWVYAGGTWRKLQLGSPLLGRLRGKAEALRVRARNLAGASRARYYLAESVQEAKLRLDQSAAALALDAAALGKEARDAAVEAAGQAKTQLQWAGEHLAEAAAVLELAESSLARPAPAAIHRADAAREQLGRAVAALAEQPPPRAHARMVYDARNQKIVLFGGDALDRLLADTWVYDPATRSWAQRRPSPSPAPRSGYKMVYLPKSGKVLVVDGYGYPGKAEMWTYDTRQNQWQLLAEGGAERAAAPAGDWYPTPAAVDDDDCVFAISKENRSAATYAIRVDPTRVRRGGHRLSAELPRSRRSPAACLARIRSGLRSTGRRRSRLPRSRGGRSCRGTRGCCGKRRTGRRSNTPRAAAGAPARSTSTTTSCCTSAAATPPTTATRCCTTAFAPTATISATARSMP